MGKSIKLKLISGHYTLIDNDDYWYLKQYRWTISKQGYVRAVKMKNYKQKTVLMHRIIMCPEDGQVVDHANRNPLDNRKSNLRLASKGQNSVNKPKVKGHKSKYKGVTFSHGKWRAFLTKDNKYVHIGTYKTEQEAALAYNKEIVKHFGEFAYLNKI